MVRGRTTHAIARRGIKTADDLHRFLAAVIDDVVNERVRPVSDGPATRAKASAAKGRQR